MTRITAAVFLITVAVSAFGEETRRPIGTWRGTAHDGSVNTLVIGEKSISWKCETPNKGTMILTVPSYGISGDGVLFGCAREISYSHVKGESLKHEDLFPFACNIDLEGESMTVSGLRIFGFDSKTRQSLCATYQKPKVEESDELASSTLKASTRKP